MLRYRAHEDCYKLTKKILPHLHLEKRIGQAENLLKTTRDYAEKIAPELRERGMIARAERWERILAMNPSEK